MDDRDDPRTIPDPRTAPDDADLHALRAADPAADAVAPRTLHERIAAVPVAAEADPTAAGSGKPNDPTRATPLRARPRWVMPLAAAAAVAVGLGGGYLLGSGGIGSVPTAAADPLPVATGSDAAPAAPIGGGETTAFGPSAETSDRAVAPSAAEALDAVSPWHYSNNRRFSAPPFETGATEATVYALDGRAVYSAADAERIAAAMGIPGEAHEPDDDTWHSWIVGDVTQPGPNLSLAPSGDGSVWLSTGLSDPWSVCSAQFESQFELEGGDQDAWLAYNAEVEACVAATPLPTEQQARDALTRFLAATEVDGSQTEITVTVDDSARTITAAAARIVDGNVTEVSSRVSVAHDGLLHAYGSTAPVVPLGAYSIISADEAAARLNDPVFAPSYAAEAAREIEYDDTPVTEPPALPATGSPVPWGISEFEIASARLGLGLMTGTDGAWFLAPMYEFTDVEGNLWSVLALAEDDLDTSGGGDGGHIGILY